jgi:crotonobetainyl-CoA:carnitine CoA-transferase CaiB-like acyl-CoA transferase
MVMTTDSTASTGTPGPPLAGVRILEASLLGPAAITSQLVDLGADVIKIESPQGDYIREMTWPIIEGVSLMHLHLNRGKRSIVLDLKTDEGVSTFLELARHADAVIEAMRPGALERRGLGFDRLREVNPRIVFCTISGYGMTGPYAKLPSHGVAYDTWAGIVTPEYDDEGHCHLPEHVSIGINAGPLYGALGVLAGIIRARDTGEACRMEIAQSDAAAAFDWYRSETHKAYDRPQSEVTGNKSDNYERRAPGTAGMKDGVRYQLYESADGHILFMASEREFWKNFCEGVGRPDLFEAHPGAKYADHAVGDLELRDELEQIFRTRTSAEWIAWSEEVNTTIAPVNTPKTIADDPQFADRLGFMPASEHGADMLPTPIKLLDEQLPLPATAPTVGQHTDEVLHDVLGWDAARIAGVRATGALG